MRALASVLSQDAVDRLEILLLDLVPGEPPPLPGSEHSGGADRPDACAAGHAASLAGEAAAYAGRLRSR